MGIDSHLSTCVDTQSPKYLEMAQGHISLSGVRSRDLQVGDLVLRLRQDARGRHKLMPPWEGPFVVAKVLKPETYKLANGQGEVYSNAWNIQQLRRFYP
jgi:hypothetical protein